MYQEWYTVAEVAAKEQCCTKTIRTYIKLGYLKASRRGPRNIFIHVDDYDAMYRPYGKSYLRKY